MARPKPNPEAPAASATFPVHRAIIALDIEGSTTRTNPVKRDLRRLIYELLHSALHAAGISGEYLSRLTDRGDGVLALIRPADEVPKTLLLDPVIPVLCALLAEHNAGAPGPEWQMRLRVVIHAGEVHDDQWGAFGEAVDLACRLLDAPRVKKALRQTLEPLVLVVSDDLFWAVVRHGYGGLDDSSFEKAVRVNIGGRRREGWIHVPATAHRGVALVNGVAPV